MSITGAAAYLARRAAQKERVRILYRRTLKDTLNWAVHRHIFYQDVLLPLSIYPFLLIAMIVL
jgi:NADH dehydrogenase (ubiquinone) 1 beta subcomplex subunit 9